MWVCVGWGVCVSERRERELWEAWIHMHSCICECMSVYILYTCKHVADDNMLSSTRVEMSEMYSCDNASSGYLFVSSSFPTPPTPRFSPHRSRLYLRTTMQLVLCGQPLWVQFSTSECLCILEQSHVDNYWVYRTPGDWVCCEPGPLHKVSILTQADISVSRMSDCRKYDL